MHSQVDGPSPSNSQLVLIDSTLYSARELDDERVRHVTTTVASLAAAAKELRIPSTITTRETPSESGISPFTALKNLRVHRLIRRTELNAWDNVAVQKVLAENGRRFLIVSELWAEDQNFSFALTALLKANYQAYLVADASYCASADQQARTFGQLQKAGVVLTTHHQILRTWMRAMNPGDQQTFLRNHSAGPALDPGRKLLAGTSK